MQAAGLGSPVALLNSMTSNDQRTVIIEENGSYVIGDVEFMDALIDGVEVVVEEGSSAEVPEFPTSIDKQMPTTITMEIPRSQLELVTEVESA